MRFLVPQFIEIEDKIIGPLTLKQGIYMLGGAGFAVALFVQFGLFVAVLFGGPVLLFAFVMAFIKIHGRPFVEILSSAFFFLTKNKLYLWKKDTKKKKLSVTTPTPSGHSARPASVEMNQSKLKKLAWSLDTNNIFDKKQ